MGENLERVYKYLMFYKFPLDSNIYVMICLREVK